jgi:hypothetical protein
MGENDQSNGRHKRRSATLLLKGFSSAPALAKVTAGISYLADKVYDAHQAEHRQLQTFRE